MIWERFRSKQRVWNRRFSCGMISRYQTSGKPRTAKMPVPGAFSGLSCGGGLRAASPYRVKGEAPWQVEGGSPIGSRAKRLGGLRAASPIGSRVETPCPARVDACVNSYWVLPDAKSLRFGSFAALPLTGEIFKQEGGCKLETDTAQWAFRQERHL